MRNISKLFYSTGLFTCVAAYIIHHMCIVAIGALTPRDFQLIASKTENGDGPWKCSMPHSSRHVRTHSVF